jgi:soluble lytic murein transglycosylase-like protein
VASDGIAGRITLTALSGGHSELAPVPVVRRLRPVPSGIPSLLAYWSRFYGVDTALVRALSWMESGFNPNLISAAGARGALQVLPVTHRYVENVLLGRRVPPTAAGEIQVGVAYLRQLLREFRGSKRHALAGWYQGPASVRRHGPFRSTKTFVAAVLALEQRGV